MNLGKLAIDAINSLTSLNSLNSLSNSFKLCCVNLLSEWGGSGISQKKPSKGSHKRNILGWIVRDEFLILEEQICCVS